MKEAKVDEEKAAEAVGDEEQAERERMEAEDDEFGRRLSRVVFGSVMAVALCGAVVILGACTGINSLVKTFFPETDVPVAVAGPDRVVVVGDRVYLDDAGSTSGVSLWAMASKPAGSAAALTVERGTATFVADVPGSYGLVLAVTAGGKTSKAVEVSVNAISVPGPTAAAVQAPAADSP